MDRHVASKSVESAMTKVWINQGLSDVTTNVVFAAFPVQTGQDLLLSRPSSLPSLTAAPVTVR